MNKQDASGSGRTPACRCRGALLVSAANSIGLFAPSVAKPVGGGSSIDIEICQTVDAALPATETVAEIPGRCSSSVHRRTGITVGILEERAAGPDPHHDHARLFDAIPCVGNDATHHFDLNLRGR